MCHRQLECRLACLDYQPSFLETDDEPVTNHWAAVELELCRGESSGHVQDAPCSPMRYTQSFGMHVWLCCTLSGLMPIPYPLPPLKKIMLFHLMDCRAKRGESWCRAQRYQKLFSQAVLCTLNIPKCRKHCITYFNYHIYSKNNTCTVLILCGSKCGMYIPTYKIKSSQFSWKLFIYTRLCT
jgi:hypothetical protein